MKIQNKQPVSTVTEIRTMVPYRGGEGAEWKRHKGTFWLYGSEDCLGQHTAYMGKHSC